MSATETVGTWRPAWGLPPPLPSGPRHGCLAQNGTADGSGPHEASPPNPLNEAECGGCGRCQTWLSAPPCPHATLLSRHLSPGAVQRPTQRPQMAERGRRRQRGPCRGSGAPRQRHNLGSPVTGSSHVPAAKGGTDRSWVLRGAGLGRPMPAGPDFRPSPSLALTQRLGLAALAEAQGFQCSSSLGALGLRPGPHIQLFAPGGTEACGWGVKLSQDP